MQFLATLLLKSTQKFEKWKKKDQKYVGIDTNIVRFCWLTAVLMK